MEEEVDEFGIPIKREDVDEFGIPINRVDEYGIPINEPVNEGEAIGEAIGAISPVAKGVYDFGRTIYSGLTDTTPQTVAQANEVRKSAMYSETLPDYIRNNQSVEFQKYVREREPEYQGLYGFFTPFKGVDEYMDKYGKEFLESRGLGEKVEKLESNLPKVTQRRQELEEYVKTQKAEAEQKLGGVVQDFRDIESVSDFASYIGGLGGQAAYQIPLSVGTRGLSSYIMESATVYDKQLDNLAQEHGISREEVIERGLDDPAAGQAYAIAAGALDAASAGNIVNAFRKQGGSLLKKFITQQTEGVTEASQGVLEDLGAGGKLAENLTEEGIAARANEYFGGVVGGTFNFFGKSDQKKLADKAINEVADTGDAELNGIIDAEATLTPQEEEVIKTKKAEENLEEVKAQEEKLVKQEESKEESQSANQDAAENTATNASEEAEIKSFDQTPEYINANEKIRGIADQIRQNPDQQELFTQLNEAIQERDNARIAFDKRKPRTKKDRSVQMTPNEAVIAQIRIQDRGIKIGRDLTQEQVVSKIKEAAKEANLTPKQVASIASRAERVSLTPKSLEKYNDYVQKVVADANYSDKVAQANSLRKKIRKRAKNATPKEKQAFKEFIQINPEEVNIDNYIKIAEETTQGFRSVTDKNYKPLNLQTLNDFTANEVTTLFTKEFPDNTEAVDTADKLALIKDKRESERREAQNERLRRKLEKDFTPEEVDGFMEVLSNETEVDKEITDLNKREKIRQVFKQLADQRQKDLPDIEDLSSRQQGILDSMKAANLSDLTADQLKLFIQLSDRISENGDFGKAGYMPVILKAQEEYKKAEKLGINPLGITSFEREVSANLPAVFRAITGLPTDAGKFQLYLGIKGMNEAAVESVKASENFVSKMNDMNDKFTKLYGSNRNGFTDESIFRQGVFAELIKHDALSNPDEFLVKNMEAVEATIQAYKESGQDQEAKVYDKLYAPFRKAKTIQEVTDIMNRIDPAGKRVVDFIVDHMKPYGERVNESNLLYYNKPSQDIVNYAGESRWFTVSEVSQEKSVDESDIKDIEGLSNYKIRPANPKQDRSQMEFKRIIPKGKVLDFNLHHKVNHQIQRVHFKTEATPHMLQIREMTKNKERMKQVLGGGAKGDNLYSKLFNPNDGAYFVFENNLLNKGDRPTDFDRGVRRAMNTLRKWGYTLRLGGLTQWFKQPTVLINTVAQVGDPSIVRNSVSEIYADPQGYQEFVKGETVSMRGEQKSLFNIGDSYIASLDRNLKNDINQAFGKGLAKHTEKVFENKYTGIGALVRADRFAANPSYVSFYKKHLKDIGQRWQGFAEENRLRNTPERQEARAVAKQMLDDLQVVSNPAEMVADMQSKRDYKTQVMKAILFPFGGFSTATKQRLFSDWRALASGNSKQKNYAVKDIAATLAEQTVFQLIAQFGMGFLWDQVGDVYEYAFDLPEDDDEEKYKKWWQRTWTGMIFDNLPLILTAPGEEMLTDAINYVGYELYKADTGEDISYKQYGKDVGLPLAKFTKPTDNELDIVLDYLGPIAAPFQNAISIGETLGEGYNEDLTPEQRRLAFLVFTMQMANFSGLWPSDVTSGSLRELREQKKMNEAAAGVSVGGEVTETPNLPDVPDLPDLPDLPELN